MENGQHSDLYKDHKAENDKCQCHPSIVTGCLNSNDGSQTYIKACVYNDTDQQSEKRRVVIFSNAVVQKHTMVIESLNTAFATATVVTGLTHIANTLFAKL